MVEMNVLIVVYTLLIELDTNKVDLNNTSDNTTVIKVNTNGSFVHVLIETIKITDMVKINIGTTIIVGYDMVLNLFEQRLCY